MEKCGGIGGKCDNRIDRGKREAEIGREKVGEREEVEEILITGFRKGGREGD